MQPIDVTMVAARRPQLVAEVIAAFRENLFSRVPIGRVFLNIDPLWGDDGDADEVERLVRSGFRDYPGTEIEVTRPNAPSLTAALKSLWGKPRTEWFLHMEDDWALDIPIDHAKLRRPMRDTNVAQIRFSWWYPTKRFTRPVEFGTAPAFNRSAFARRVAELMDPSLHPERQVYDGSNPALSAWVRQRKQVYYGSIFTPAAIRDLGKAWRLQRGIEKSTHQAMMPSRNAYDR